MGRDIPATELDLEQKDRLLKGYMNPESINSGEDVEKEIAKLEEVLNKRYIKDKTLYFNIGYKNQKGEKMETGIKPKDNPIQASPLNANRKIMATGDKNVPEDKKPEDEIKQKGEQITILQYLSGKKEFTHFVKSNALKENRKYIKDPSQAPAGVNIQQGDRGGFYYDETPNRGAESPPSDMDDSGGQSGDRDMLLGDIGYSRDDKQENEYRSLNPDEQENYKKSIRDGNANTHDDAMNAAQDTEMSGDNEGMLFSPEEFKQKFSDAVLANPADYFESMADAIGMDIDDLEGTDEDVQTVLNGYLQMLDDSMQNDPESWQGVMTAIDSEGDDITNFEYLEGDVRNPFWVGDEEMSQGTGRNEW